MAQLDRVRASSTEKTAPEAPKSPRFGMVSPSKLQWGIGPGLAPDRRFWTKNAVTFCLEGVRRSAWANFHVARGVLSISGTFGSIPHVLVGSISKKHEILLKVTVAPDKNLLLPGTPL